MVNAAQGIAKPCLGDNMKRMTFTTAALLLATVAAPAMAAEVIYTDERAFRAATTPFVEGFDDATLRTGLEIDSTIGSISGGVFNDRVVAGSAQTLFTFRTPISAFGALFDLSPGGAGQGIRITLSGGRNLSVEVSRTAFGEFFGFTSNTPFTSVLFRGGTQGGTAETYTIDNLQFGLAGNTGPIPEPSTWALMILGFGALGVALRRRNGANVSVRYA